jgi:hypothetical protein
VSDYRLLGATSYNYVPYVRFFSPYLEVKLNNSETSYLNVLKVGHPKIISTQISEQKILM